MIQAIKQARAALGMLSAEEVRRRASAVYTFGLVADNERAYQEMEAFLIPPGAPPAERARLRSLVYRADSPDVPAKVDFVLYQDGAAGPEGTYVFHSARPERTASEIAHRNEEAALALARAYPSFRGPVVERIIHATAFENLLFSVATALPDVIPNLIELPWAFGEFASDTAFLTANQVRMAFQIAGACGKEPGFSHQRAEIAGIAAGAFGWRAIARELASKIPFGGGLAPKGAMAYAVTYGIGMGLARLYQARAPYTKAERRRIYEQAYQRGRELSDPSGPGQ
ncbi:MAG TPA: hypothetical protein VMU19_08080 [Bryobacteraceae bacterium]|nr:hypothetical protein [Bryobacteraceae bacterium]